MKKIESRSDYDKIKNDPILLLKTTKEHALNYQENRYSMSIILDAIRTLMGTKQKDGESLKDYTKRFWVAQDVLKSHIGGPIILTKIVEAHLRVPKPSRLFDMKNQISLIW